MRLYQLAHCRAGDKGDTSILSLVAYRREDYALLVERVSAGAVKRMPRGGDVKRSAARARWKGAGRSESGILSLGATAPPPSKPGEAPWTRHLPSRLPPGARSESGATA